MSFRIGRKFARHTYPDTPRAGGLAALASNYALGPGTDQAITTSGTPVFTNTNGATVAAGTLTADGVPITPRVTRNVLLEAVVNVRNPSEVTANVFVYAEIDGVVSTDPIAAETVAPGYEAIPVLLPGLTALSLGAAAHFNLVVVASSNTPGLLLTAGSGSGTLAAQSTMALREVPLATG